MDKVLVTGSEGFIGSHLVEALVRSGHKVRAFVLYNSFNSRGWLDFCACDVKGQFEVFPGDIRDPHGVRKSMEGCDAVLHLAALIGIPYSYHSPDTYVDTNIKGTLNILQAAKERGVKRVIHTSTSEVYGTALSVPIREDHPLQGQSPYSATKIAADQLAFAFHRSFGLPVTILRPFNTYGPRQSARAVIPTIITQILKRKKEISLGSLHPTRDLVYVEDTVAGFVEALKAPKIEGEVIQLGTGHEVSIGGLVETISRLMGVKIKIRGAQERVRPMNSEVERLLADPAKAKQMLKWEPKHRGTAGLEKGLLKTIEWFRRAENFKYYEDDRYII
ncbi:MAG: NAD-dependent epimerase/dehydratase family protein [Bacteroidetes bacterium]|nr:NAD-dependent epimerase/dehydratase family protein [Bacteroidota bacterium]